MNGIVAGVYPPSRLYSEKRIEVVGVGQIGLGRPLASDGVDITDARVNTITMSGLLAWRPAAKCQPWVS